MLKNEIEEKKKGTKNKDASQPWSRSHENLIERKLKNNYEVQLNAEK
jgi:hypothetical protein